MNTNAAPLHLASSRALEYFSEKELAMQAGTGPDDWGLLLLKELIDNALDACEAAGTAPRIAVYIEPNGFSVSDNGPGIPAEVVVGSLDYTVRVSDKSLRVAPTRGQLGNALKLAYAAPFVLDGAARVTITARGIKHDISVGLDRIQQEPVIDHQQTPAPGSVGTEVIIWSSQLAGQLLDEHDDSYREVDPFELADRIVAFNPHARVEVHMAGERHVAEGTVPDFAKWHIGRPASPWWYSVETLGDLIAGYLANGQGDMPLRDFLASFHGLKGTQARAEVLADANLSGAYLRNLHDGVGGLREGRVVALLEAMRARSRAVKPKALGPLGQGHLEAVLREQYAAEPTGYSKAVDDDAAAPFVVEVAVGVVDDPEAELLTVCGLNHTPAFGDPLPRLLYELSEHRIDSYDPVVVLVHIAVPRFQYSEHGKGRVVMPMMMRLALAAAVEKAAKPWAKAKEKADRRGRVRRREVERLRKESKQKPPDMKASCWKHMRTAYMKASAGGTLPANARQIMYAIRGKVLDDCGKWYAQSATFTQQILPDYIDAHPDETADWNVVYDARGKAVEPHTGRRIDLGTLAVRNYIATWGKPGMRAAVQINPLVDNRGPVGRYSAALFIEKEGFDPLLQAAGIAEAFDVLVMSTKGMSVTACRELAEALAEQGVPIFVLHDLDKAGFSIIETLRSDTRRHQYAAPPEVVDLGFRLDDPDVAELEREVVTYAQKVSPAERLAECGATEEEIATLVNADSGDNGVWSGERIELNAIASDEFIDWLQRRLIEHGVEKVQPGAETLAAAYRRAVLLHRMQAACDRIAAEATDDIEVPDNLAELVAGAAEAEPARPWDEIIHDAAGKK